MRAGEFPNGARVLRAKIDMASPNINLRDPVLYRIVHATHPRTGDRLVHLPDVRLRPRPVGRDRGRHALDLHARVRGPPTAVRLAHRAPAGADHPAPDRVRPTQPDPHRALASGSCCGSSTEGHVRGWDDPRMPTISGLRRRGFPAEGIREFADMIGVSKTDSVIEIGQLEYAVRAVLNRTAVAAVRRPRPAQGRDRELPGRTRSRRSRS